MAMDKSDSRLVNGAIIAAVVLGVVYFWPEGWLGVDGLAASWAKEAVAKSNVKTMAQKYEEFYSPMQTVHWGEDGESKISDADVHEIEGLKRLYNDANVFTKERIVEKQEANKIAFPDWTEVPPEERDAGTYFRKIWDRHRSKVEIACTNAKVDLDDLYIGFQSLSGKVPDSDKAKEYLRELYITEKIIDLAIQAKLGEEQRERTLGKKPEAFMRIMLVEPRDSEPTGPTALIPNPKFDPNEKNPASPKFKRYNIDRWSNFIQEYPVKIQLICDTNTFIQFMHSVRTPKDPQLEFTGMTPINGETAPKLKYRDTGQVIDIKVGDYLPDLKYTVTKIDPLGITFKDADGKSVIVLEGQFLVIRQLEILSPSLEDSNRDKNELREFKGEASEAQPKRRWPERKEQVVVTIVAAGMDFFDPVEHPGGLHPKKKEAGAVAGPRPRHVMGQGMNQAKQP